MDDHPLLDPLLDMGEGESLIPPPRVAMYLGEAMRGMWAGLYVGATWGVLLWGTIGAVVGAICGLMQGLLLGSMDEVRAQAATLALFGAVVSGLMAIFGLSTLGAFTGLSSTRLKWKLERDYLAKLLKNKRHG